MDIIQRAREQIKRRYIKATDHEQNAYEIMLKLIGLCEDQAAEIERLKAELEMRDKVIKQAIEFAEIQIASDGFLESTGAMSRRMVQEKMPELYAHLGGWK